MTTALLHEQARRPLRTEEVDELCALTAGLPVLLTGWSTSVPVGLDDAALRLDAAIWALARRHHVTLDADSTVFDVVDGLGWTQPAGRDALRAFVMLRWSPVNATVEAELLACRAAGRLLAYLELRTRFG